MASPTTNPMAWSTASGRSIASPWRLDEARDRRLGHEPEAEGRHRDAELGRRAARRGRPSRRRATRRSDARRSLFGSSRCAGPRPRRTRPPRSSRWPGAAARECRRGTSRSRRPSPAEADPDTHCDAAAVHVDHLEAPAVVGHPLTPTSGMCPRRSSTKPARVSYSPSGSSKPQASRTSSVCTPRRARPSRRVGRTARRSWSGRTRRRSRRRSPRAGPRG